MPVKPSRQAPLRRHPIAAAAALLILALPAPSPAQPAHPQAARATPDYSHVTSIAARRLARSGELVRIYAFPLELGGRKDPENIVYIPPAAREPLDIAVRALKRQVEDGLADRMEVIPEYRGTSVVPSRIRFRAWHGSKPGSLELAMAVWDG